MSPPPTVSRRTLTLAGLGAALTAVVAGAVYEVPKLSKRRARGQYADLVNRLEDPEQAAIVGRALSAGEVPPEDTAKALRKKLAQRGLREVIADDEAARRMVDANGWVLPGTLAELCRLAAQSV
jgi:hypothetical protein